MTYLCGEEIKCFGSAKSLLFSIFAVSGAREGQPPNVEIMSKACRVPASTLGFLQIHTADLL